MTAAAALLDFFSRAIPGWSAYVETGVPSKAAGDAYDATFPYLTYSFPTSSFNFGEVSISVNLWDKKRGASQGGSQTGTATEATMNAAAATLSAAIGRGGVTLPCDGGYIWLKRGAPFSQAMPDEDVTIKRRYINVIAEYATTD